MLVVAQVCLNLMFGFPLLVELSSSRNRPIILERYWCQEHLIGLQDLPLPRKQPEFGGLSHETQSTRTVRISFHHLLIRNPFLSILPDRQPQHAHVRDMVENVTNELLLEHMSAMRTELASLAGQTRELRDRQAETHAAGIALRHDQATNAKVAAILAV